MLTLNNLMGVIGYSVVLIVGFFITYAKLYDFCKFVDKVKARKAKQKQLNKRKERLFINNKVA